ncbi:MAG: hypothetical protein ACE5IJ_08865, partial [Thermoplasmata archaeon]
LIEQGGDGLGDVVVTSLVNYCMPFIRYAIGDVASGIREECDCGRAHTTLASVEGKLEGLIARRGGRFIAAVFSTPFKGMPVWQYSVVQRDYDHFTFLVVPMKGFREKHANIITRKALGILGPAEVEFIEVDRIPPLPGGKHRYVTSEVPYKPPWLET